MNRQKRTRKPALFFKQTHWKLLFSLSSMLFLFSSCSSDKSEKVDFHGVSFQMQGVWEVTKEEDAANSLYYIGCEKDDDTADVFVVRFTEKEIEPIDFLENYLSSLRRRATLSSEKVEEGRFGQYPCVFVDYAFAMSISDFYGTVYAFRTNNKTILIVKQSPSKRRLENKFEEIEATFRVEEKANDF